MLSGGAARGAYEAGVLSYLFNELPKKLLQSSRIQLLCGTSVGAVHASFLAANAHVPHRNIGRLLHVWRSFVLDRMLRLGVFELLRLPSDVRRMLRSRAHIEGVIVNSRSMERLVREEISWANIARNLERGIIDGLTATATHAESGRSVVFVDRADGLVPNWTRDVRTIARPVRLGPLHALASAAIPFLFPAVLIDGCYYVDGGLRQNTPLSPALRMGADRALVVSLRHEERRQPTLTRGGSLEDYPGPFLMLGKVLDALMLDHLDYDLARLEGFNTLLREGREAFGERFSDEMGNIAERVRGARYREVQAVTIRPSRDIGEMATEFLHIHRSRFKGSTGWILGRLAASDFLRQSDLLSYILFDGRFAEALIELGRSDADASREQLIEFLKD